MAFYKDRPALKRIFPTASLYIHVPFCAGTCDYCDFYSVPAGPEDPMLDCFVGLVLEDTGAALEAFGIRKVPTVYIGGGTPSVLGSRRTARLLSGLLCLLPNVPDEFSIEANPESADRAFMETIRSGGVTRISLGVQTFHEASRLSVHRVGEGALLPERLGLAREVFGDNFSADLITGLPFQDEAALRSDLERLVSFKPGHVSLYSLSLEPGTPLNAGLLPSKDEADRLWILGRDFLEKTGYAHYEVSSFSLPGKRCVHNIRYWRMESWLGIGPGASGTLIDEDAGTGLRRSVIPGLESYLGRKGGVPPPAREERLSRRTLMKESLLMGFRYAEGPDADLFRRRFGLGLEEAVPRTLAAWRRRGLLGEGGSALNREGLLFLNAFVRDAFAELDSGETPAELSELP